MRLDAPAPASIWVAFLLSTLTVAFCGVSASRLYRLPSSRSTKYLTEEEHWFNQTLDHFSPYDHRQFAQRYYEHLEDFRIPDGPIFLKICGEYVCDGIANDYLAIMESIFYVGEKPQIQNEGCNNSKIHVKICHAVLVLAKKFGAAVVSLEHRYYGKSSPFSSSTIQNLRYLSSKQALFDLAVFRQFYQESLNAKLNRSTENQWFVFGISYAGALSAWFRLKFPHLTCGSLASSGVVLAVYNFTEFDKQIGVSAGPECKSVLQEITSLVDQRLELNERELKRLFDAAELKNGDFLYFLADAAVMAFQYGNPDALCVPLIEAKKAGKNLVEAYAAYMKEHFVKSWGNSVETYDQQHLRKTTLTGDNSDRLWWFQVCTEVAYFQVAPSNDSIRSSKVDTRYHLDLCKNVFGSDIYPDVDATNIYYGGIGISGSKIIFTNGSQDPWQCASKQTSSPEMPSYIIKCHNCGHGTDMRGCPQSPSAPEGNAKNCSSPDAVNKVRQKIIDHMDLWLSQCHSSARCYV